MNRATATATEALTPRVPSLNVGTLLPCHARYRGDHVALVASGTIAIVFPAESGAHFQLLNQDASGGLLREHFF